jgi:hypothetical protein
LYNGRESFSHVIVFYDEVTFKVNGAINRHSCATENPNKTEKGAVNLHGTFVWCSISSRKSRYGSHQHKEVNYFFNIKSIKINKKSGV